MLPFIEIIRLGKYALTSDTSLSPNYALSTKFAEAVGMLRKRLNHHLTAETIFKMTVHPQVTLIYFTLANTNTLT